MHVNYVDRMNCWGDGLVEIAKRDSADNIRKLKRKLEREKGDGEGNGDGDGTPRPI